MQYVADNPEVPDNDLISLPVWELVSRTLFEVANSPTSNSTRSMRRANVARDIILKRLVGRRMRAGQVHIPPPRRRWLWSSRI
jgi:hypothetical protein